MSSPDAIGTYGPLDLPFPSADYLGQQPLCKPTDPLKPSKRKTPTDATEKKREKNQTEPNRRHENQKSKTKPEMTVPSCA